MLALLLAALIALIALIALMATVAMVTTMAMMAMMALMASTTMVMAMKARAAMEAMEVTTPGTILLVRHGEFWKVQKVKWQLPKVRNLQVQLSSKPMGSCLYICVYRCLYMGKRLSIWAHGFL